MNNAGALRVVRWYVGGRSAGHIMPLRAYAQQDRLKGDHAFHRFIVGSSTVDYACVQDAPEIDAWMSVGSAGLRARGWTRYIRVCWWMLYDILMLTRYVYREQPQEIITTGGGVAVPVLLWALCLKIPVRVYELNAIPGRVVAWCVWWGWPVYTVFPHAFCARSIRAYPVPYPFYIRARSAVVDRAAACTRYGLDPEHMTVVLLGGSQGSAWLNTHMPALIAQAAEKQAVVVQVVHQAGNIPSEIKAHILHVYTQAGIRAQLVDFESDSLWLYAVADRIMCRAGSGTLHEAGSWEVPTLVIPLPEEVTDHQVANARAWCSQQPATRRWFGQESSPESLVSAISWLLSRP